MCPLGYYHNGFVLSYFKAVAVITGRTYCFQDCRYIALISLLWDIERLVFVLLITYDLFFMYIYAYIYIYIYIYTYIYIYIIHVLLSRCVNELVFKIYLKHILFCKCFAAIFEMFCKCFAASNFTIPFSQHFTVQPLIKMIS